MPLAGFPKRKLFSCNMSMQGRRHCQVLPQTSYAKSGSHTFLYVISVRSNLECVGTYSLLPLINC